MGGRTFGFTVSHWVFPDPAIVDSCGGDSGCGRRQSLSRTDSEGQMLERERGLEGHVLTRKPVVIDGIERTRQSLDRQNQIVGRILHIFHRHQVLPVVLVVRYEATGQRELSIGANAPCSDLPRGRRTGIVVWRYFRVERFGEHVRVRLTSAIVGLHEFIPINCGGSAHTTRSRG